ncbi:aldolase/citrate lyase family protein [Chloroflexota bacterium]
MGNALPMSCVNDYLACRQHLVPGSQLTQVVQVTRDIAGLHATGAAGPYLSLWAYVMPRLCCRPRAGAAWCEFLWVRRYGSRKHSIVVRLVSSCQVSSAEHAQRVVSFCRYPPDGVWDIDLARAKGYGTRFREYVASANDQLVVVIQAETPDAVANIGTIVQVPGIDAILIGPFDLSSSLGKPGALDGAEVTPAIARVRDVRQQGSVRLGAFAANVRAARAFIGQGFTPIAADADIMFLSEAVQDTLASVAQIANDRI